MTKNLETLKKARLFTEKIAQISTIETYGRQVHTYGRIVVKSNNVQIKTCRYKQQRLMSLILKDGFGKCREADDRHKEKATSFFFTLPAALLTYRLL